MKMKVKRYKLGTDPRTDALLAYHPGYTLYLVEGYRGSKGVLVPVGIKRPRFKAMELYNKEGQ